MLVYNVYVCVCVRRGHALGNKSVNDERDHGIRPADHDVVVLKDTRTRCAYTCNYKTSAIKTLF